MIHDGESIARRPRASPSPAAVCPMDGAYAVRTARDLRCMAGINVVDEALSAATPRLATCLFPLAVSPSIPTRNCSECWVVSLDWDCFGRSLAGRGKLALTPSGRSAAHASLPTPRRAGTDSWQRCERRRLRVGRGRNRGRENRPAATDSRTDVHCSYAVLFIGVAEQLFMRRRVLAPVRVRAIRLRAMTCRGEHEFVLRS